MKISSGKSFCVIGNLYDIDFNSTSLKSIFISDGKIISIIDGEANNDLVSNFSKIVLKEDEIIFPNFINLHTHIGYNILPIWDSKNIWNSRHQWRNAPNYTLEISGLIKFIKESWIDEPLVADQYFQSFFTSEFLNSLFNSDNSQYVEMYKVLALSEIQKAHAILSEIMAVCGGTGVLLQTLKLDDEHPDEMNFIIRNTGNNSDLGIDGSKKIYAVVDFFKPCSKTLSVENCNNWKPNGTSTEDTNNWYPNPTKDKNGESPLKQFIDSVNNNNLNYHSTIVHIGEGNSGYLKNPDPYTSLESKETISELSNRIHNMDNLKKSNLVFVHANGFDYSNIDVIKFFRDNNISIVWSPVSNLILYNDTLPIKNILDAGINVCLGTDWTPSGSKHMLDELKFTKYMCNKLNLNISDLDILKMATVNPSKAIGIENLNKIVAGGNADFFVLKNPKKVNNALELLFNTNDSEIKCSMINGRFVYGDVSFFNELNVDFQKLPESDGEFTSKKAVSLNKNINFSIEKALSQIDKLLNIYSTANLQSPVSRTKFLATDDKDYMTRIEKLKNLI